MTWRNSMERPWRRWKRELFKTKVTIPCFYCNKALSQKEASVDHIIPKSKGGPNDPSNYLISCRKCNSDRGNTDIEIWVEKIIQS
jgi:5-methylcytosine-specific restriction endonuclease McrA